MTQASVLQMISNASVRANISQAESLIEVAKRSGSELAVLPENFAFMGMKESDKLSICEHFLTGEIQQMVAAMAKKYQIWIIAGTIALRSETCPGKVRASSLVFDDKGKVAARYDKIHLFDVALSPHETYHESQTVEPGDSPVIVDTPLGVVGLSVCYDLRFPELYQRLRALGATVFAIPSAFTAATGLAHWQILLRARAIENLCYVLASNQGGTHQNGRSTYGHSMIVDPWGQVLAAASIGASHIIAEVNETTVETLRKQLPCDKHHIMTR